MAVALWAGTRAATAGEAASPATGASTAKTETIEAARQELRQMQVGREALNSNPTGLPRVTAPEWHGGSTPAVLAVTPRAKPAPDARNPNWLVDAMRKPGETSTQGRSRDGRREEFESGPQFRSANDWEPVDERGETAKESRESGDRDPIPVRPAAANAAINPLASFLDDWMSPQDYALLQPGLAASRSGQVGLPTPATSFGPALTERSAIPPLMGNATQTTGLPGAGGAGKPSENPFLQALEPSIAILPPSLPPPRAAISPPGPASLRSPAAPAISPLPPPRVPEFARPASDEKHFKPLKRF